MLTLRNYQQEAVDAVIRHTEISRLPCCVVLPTGAGKSLVVGALAGHFGTALCLHPTKELVAQNAAKCAAMGVEHTVYCAGLGEKDFSGPVVLGTGASIRKDLKNLPHVDVLIVDEAHRNIAETLMIYALVKEINPDVVMVGLTATPYVMGSGYIYRINQHSKVWDDKKAKNPPYSKCVYELPASYLVEKGYLSPITVGRPSLRYDDRNLQVERGKFTAGSVQKALKAETTFHIAAEIQQIMQHRDTCMIFASSVDHARQLLEIIGRQARMITGETSAHSRDLYIDMLRRRRIRYLINVATLTTGVDIPRVDTIAVLRFSESAALIEQIKGRGMRLSPETGKTDCLYLDYAGNVERFYPTGDIYSPQIQSINDKEEGFVLPVECPTCGHMNEFKGMPNDEGLMISGDGYFMTLDGHKVRDENGNEIPAHYGRRCQGASPEGVQCSHRWIGKKCMKCQHENDIAARKCQCGNRLVDWNKSLTKAASEIGTVQLRRGWTGARVEQLRFKETPKWIRADLYVKNRKGPLSVFITTPEAHHRMRQNMPYAVAWKNTGHDYADVKVLWTISDWENYR